MHGSTRWMQDIHQREIQDERESGAAIAVHRALGPGLLESAYEASELPSLLPPCTPCTLWWPSPVAAATVPGVDTGAGRDVGGRSRLGAAQPATRRGAPDSSSTSAEVI